MCERTYDIIDWKSCESSSPSECSTGAQKDLFNLRGVYPLSRDEILSTTDIVFPKLFNEQRQSGTSIVSTPDHDHLFDGPLHYYTELDADIYDEQTVYQKVANWVLTQRKYFRNVEPIPDDDEMEVIDPVDLFHESNLTDYQLITENDTERRELLRDFDDHRYHIETIDESMKINEYRFLRKPKGEIELELTPIVDFDKLYKTETLKHKHKRKDSISTVSSYVEQREEHLNFLGVPRLLENYTILNREGYVIKQNEETDIWLEPVDEGLIVKDQDTKSNEFDLDFISSWFSDVYQTDLNTDEVRTLATVDMFEKVTVISISNCSEEEVWMDAPDIPYWFDDEQEELELFNQPSKPLYYYRDRIKGCYRIIGVEDDTVVLFSGNDDDTIFYADNDINSQDHIQHNYANSWSDGERERSVNLQRLVRTDSDHKTDSGIEDIDDMICEEVAIASISISTESAKSLKTSRKVEKTVTFASVSLQDRSSVEILFVVLAGILVLLTIILSKTNTKDILYRTKNESIDYIYYIYSNIRSIFGRFL